MTSQQSAWQRKLELGFGITALVLFCLHILAILAAQAGVLQNEILQKSSVVLAISTPFTIILLYEVLQLGLSFRKPLIYSILIQLELISLIYIRKVFEMFAHIDTTLVTNTTTAFVAELTLTLISSIALFAVVYYIFWLLQRGKLQFHTEPMFIVKVKRMIAGILLVGSVLTLLAYANQYILPDVGTYILQGINLSSFFINVFTLMIVADVVLFILAFLYRESYFEVFENAVFVASALVIRFTLTLQTPFDALLVFLGCGLIISIIWFHSREQYAVLVQ